MSHDPYDFYCGCVPIDVVDPRDALDCPEIYAVQNYALWEWSLVETQIRDFIGVPTGQDSVLSASWRSAKVAADAYLANDFVTTDAELAGIQQESPGTVAGDVYIPTDIFLGLLHWMRLDGVLSTWVPGTTGVKTGELSQSFGGLRVGDMAEARDAVALTYWRMYRRCIER